MKRAEIYAWAALAGLLAIAAALLTGGLLYHTTYFWVGMMAALGQSLVVGLAAWGLMLARQNAEIVELPPMGRNAGSPSFSMTFGDAPTEAAASGVRTLDTGFQRIVVGLTAALLLGLAFISYHMVSSTFAWAKANPDKPFPIAGSLGKPQGLDELSLVIGIGAGIAYVVLWWQTRARKEAAVDGEAVESTLTLGAPGFVGLAVASVLAYLQAPYASEAAAGLFAFLLALEGVELFVNALRSYSGVDELDQVGVDLQAQPLAPMLSSYWLGGVKMLLAQSVGITGQTEAGDRGVFARLMPRALVALAVIAIALSCFRVVPAGNVAILERLGTAIPASASDATPRLLDPGLHLTFPWPIDRLVWIPKYDLQYTGVGTELHATSGGGVEFQFWTIGHEAAPPGQENDEFITGDVSSDGTASPQLLETYVGVWWRVNDPVLFYQNLSHSDFYEKDAEGTTALPIYAALVQQATSYAVTKTFAIHSLQQILISDRSEVNTHCRQILQDKLNQAKSGIEVVDLTIKDLHPPFGQGIQDDPNSPDGKRYGPANAFENVVTALQTKEGRIDLAEAQKLGVIKVAEGEAAAMISNANADKATRIAKAQGEAARLSEMMDEIAASPDADKLLALAKMNALNAAMTAALATPAKVLSDPRIKVYLWETNKQGAMPIRPAGQ